MGAFDLAALLFPDADQGRQPQYPVQVSKTQKLARGIVLAEHLRYRQAALGGQLNTLVGTAGVAGRGGIGVSFGGADSLACPFIPDSIKRTILCVTVAKGSGAGGNLGRMFDTRNAGLLGYSVWRDDSAGQESFNRGWSTSNGQWYWTAAPAGQLSALAISYDGSSAANVPTVVRNGKPQTIAVNTAPSGTINTVTDPFYLGNRRSDNARNWAGEEYLFVVWDQLFSLDELIWVTENGNYNQLFEPLSGFSIALQAVLGSIASTGAMVANGAADSSGYAAASAQVALSGIGVALATGQAAAAINVPLAAAGITVANGQAGAVATVAINASGIAQAAALAGLSPSVLAQAAGAVQAAGNAQLAVLLNALAAGTGNVSGSANLTGSAPGSLAASAQASAQGNAALAVTVQLQAVGAARAEAAANGSASAPGHLFAVGTGNASGWAAQSVLVNLTAAGFVHAMVQGALSVEVPLGASGVASVSGMATLGAVGPVSGARLVAGEAQLLTRGITEAVAVTSFLCEAVHV